jgi:hypothetical protein
MSNLFPKLTQCSFQANADDLDKAISLAEALRLFDVQYHDGGSVQKEALDTFHKAINLAKAKREEMISQGHETRLVHGSERDETYGEMLLDYGSRSIDGLLCALYTSLGKTYFMANMFERYVLLWPTVSFSPLFSTIAVAHTQQLLRRKLQSSG